MTDTVSMEVSPLLDGVRVDRAVAMIADLSRAAAAQLVQEGRVRVDGRVVQLRSAPLALGNLLEVELNPEADDRLVPEPDIAVPVLYEDEHVIVVDKPAELVVHPGAGRARGTLVAGLVARYPELFDLVDAGCSAPERPGIVHRLDRGTSGLLVVARTPDAYRSLVAQLAERTVERRYVALVQGQLEADRGIVDAPIGRSERRPTAMTVSSGGRPARTSYRVLRRYALPAPSALLALKLETGRTHQIRVHLSAIGNPVVGDDRYHAGRGRGAAPGGRLAPHRLFLHAYGLGFDHPDTGEPVRFESPLPPDLVSALGEAVVLP
jgi:23S rRNA pseudouridine1911/1915/1917 synthase